jgi:nucleoside 2-deoxyribosyltransferase
MNLLIYVAGPLFNTHERWFLEQIADTLANAGYKTFLPHRDVGLVDFSNAASRMQVFEADLKALDQADICVALLTGSDHDSGTSAELGYMHAKGKLCFGITDDRRWMNNMIWGICGGGTRIVANSDQLVPIIRKYFSDQTEAN